MLRPTRGKRPNTAVGGGGGEEEERECLEIVISDTSSTSETIPVGDCLRHLRTFERESYENKVAIEMRVHPLVLAHERTGVGAILVWEIRGLLISSLP